MSYPKLAVAIATALATSVANAADVTREVLVEDTALTEPGVDRLTTEALTGGISADGGELLRGVTGVSGVRMGGHGIDPIIRGQTQTQLNILLDGAYLHGGCPNRMDPPTAYSSADTYDRVTVIKGSQTVRYGGGGSGGTVLFERVTPRFSADDPLRGAVNGGYKGNADTRELSADVAAGTPQGFARAILGYKNSGNYQDGDGNSVRSAYKQKSGTAIFGYTPDAATRLEFSVEGTRERDTLFAGAGMDSPYSDADNFRLKFDRRAGVGPFAGVNAELYLTQVDHLMDNYSLRSNSGMRAKVPTSSDTRGGRVSVDLASGALLWTLGVDYQRNERDADKFTGMPGSDPANLQSIIWPGADLKQTGAFAELDLPLRQDDNLRFGLRYDRVEASISRGDQATSTMTPNQLYAAYYADTAESADENNVGGFARWERTLADGKGLFSVAFSRSVRTADATERYAANNMGASSWVGNNTLAPEKHHQAELGLSWAEGDWRFAGSVYLNKVDDFILRDLARGQSGILVANGTATIYRNVSATLYGAELEGRYRIDAAWEATAGLAYVHANNDTDDRPIAQIPPLEATLGLRYRRSAWDLGGTLRANATQTRADLVDGSGQDLEETSGWAVLDLDARYRANRDLMLSVGVDNLFDHTYAYHVNRGDVFNPVLQPINEPGRSAWLRAEARF